MSAVAPLTLAGPVLPQPLCAAVGAAAGTFTPKAIPGLALWLDSRFVTGFADGAAVNTVADQSGNGFTFSAATTARPTYKAGIRAGLGVLRFDGSANTLSSSAAASIAQGKAGMTFIAVYQSTLPGAVRCAVGISYTGGATAAALARERNGAATLSAGARRISTDTFASADGGTLTAGAWSIDAAVFDFANRAGQAWHNGVLVASQAVMGTVGTASGTYNVATIGSLNGTSQFMNGDVGTVLVYTGALTAAQLSYLAHGLSGIWRVALG